MTKVPQVLDQHDFALHPVTLWQLIAISSVLFVMHLLLCYPNLVRGQLYLVFAVPEAGSLQKKSPVGSLECYFSMTKLAEDW